MFIIEMSTTPEKNGINIGQRLAGSVTYDLKRQTLPSLFCVG